MHIPPKSEIKTILHQRLSRIVSAIRASSVKARLTAGAPVAAAVILAGAALLLDIVLRGAGTEGWGWRLLAGTALLAVFLAPLWFSGLRLARRIWPRLRERRFLDALLVGLYLPHVVAVLVIVVARLEGSETIASLGAALITWAMLSLLLSPFLVLLTLLGWSFLPTDEKLTEMKERTRELGQSAKALLPAPVRLNGRGQKLLGAPAEPAAALDEEKDAVRT